MEQALATAAAAAQGGSATRVRALQAMALHQVEGAVRGRAAGQAAAGAGAHGKLKALLFMMQRALCHPKQLALPQLDTIKRSLQIQQRLGLSGAGGGADGGIPLLRIDDLLSRLQGRTAQGGLVRDVGRTWAMAGDEMERERDRLEALTLQELRGRVEKEGLPMPIAWLQLPVRCAILRGADALDVTIHDDKAPAPSSAGAAASAAPSSPAPAFPAAVLQLGASPASASAAAAASAAASAAAAATAAADSNDEGNKKPAAAAAAAPAAAASTNGKAAKRLDGLLAPQDIVRVGANDEDNERVVRALSLTDPSGQGQRGVATLAPAWMGENQRRALLFKKAPATRKRAYADILLAKERESKGAASEIHEAGFTSIFALLEGHDQTCR